LVGTLIARTYPGPPNYESVATGDSSEQAYILVLEAPVCVAPDPTSDLNSKGASGALEIQVASLHLRFSTMVGQRIAVSGSLFAAHTGHHRTPVLMWAKSARAA
ncbi:MAG: DUF4431 domain-containing protein, partial [Myxococcales bacterium]|nr:DUF4431 domain-containing protein [Myxococcales bacterium]